MKARVLSIVTFTALTSFSGFAQNDCSLYVKNVMVNVKGDDTTTIDNQNKQYLKILTGLASKGYELTTPDKAILHMQLNSYVFNRWIPTKSGSQRVSTWFSNTQTIMSHKALGNVSGKYFTVEMGNNASPKKILNSFIDTLEWIPSCSSLYSGIAQAQASQNAQTFASHACGLEGSISERISNCSERTKNFALVSRTKENKEIYLDMQTGLIWSDKIDEKIEVRYDVKNGSGSYKAIKGENYYEAVEKCEGLNLLPGHSWRLPDGQEFETATAHNIQGELPNMKNWFWANDPGTMGSAIPIYSGWDGILWDSADMENFNTRCVTK